ncbi:uncharacterized protein LY89DRAFT_689792 [Mollisia scopiformis]|uniref:Uncharacterized protein n=1 Tax=Mollisia scopiformis TaxID=149040 RepID=A0A132BBU3_MOLSC|nr:uncharacterized protein LY89DRAFT_689792 [Mollisia scopiformis]KUJ09885.1 hypothetical protein LY89DRAFT_689792 [Mollisia scopiformis]
MDTKRGIRGDVEQNGKEQQHQVLLQQQQQQQQQQLFSLPKDPIAIDDSDDSDDDGAGRIDGGFDAWLV